MEGVDEEDYNMWTEKEFNVDVVEKDCIEIVEWYAGLLIFMRERCRKCDARGRVLG